MSSSSSSGEKVEGKHPCKRVIWALAEGPITRICPLQGPKEAMAAKALMEVWFTRLRVHPETLRRQEKHGLERVVEVAWQCERRRQIEMDVRRQYGERRDCYVLDNAFYGRRCS